MAKGEHRIHFAPGFVSVMRAGQVDRDRTPVLNAVV